MKVVNIKCPPCPVCSVVSIVEVLEDDLERYKRGAHIQNAFPEMPPALRELMISGTCPKCWDELWADAE